MDSDLPLIMLILASALVVLLIIYAVRYKSSRKRRGSDTRTLQEPKVGLEEQIVEPKQNESLQLDGIIGEVKVRVVETPPVTPTIEKPTAKKVSGLLVLHIMAAPEQSFIGYELLQSLLSAGLRFGEMNIFHRYEQPTGQGKILFSLASATEPGTFNIDEIGSLSCIGLSLFMDASKVENPNKVFNLMLDTARLLAEDLGGRVYDEHYQELTSDTVHHYQQRITA